VGHGPTDEEKAIMKKLRKALHQEEIWMCQRSRVNCLRERDRNTSFFYRHAPRRKHTNCIEFPEAVDGTICENRDEIHAEVQGFYQAFYHSQGFQEMDDLINFVQPKVNQEMNLGLDVVYTEEEIKCALFQMAPPKAPRVDGFTAGFFQRHWDLVKEDVVQAVLDFLNGGILPVGLNDTSITLILKVKHPQKISQFCPISLCLVLHKIRSKCIANRR
jgi:hypothetical protein